MELELPLTLKRYKVTGKPLCIFKNMVIMDTGSYLANEKQYSFYVNNFYTGSSSKKLFLLGQNLYIFPKITKKPKQIEFNYTGKFESCSNESFLVLWSQSIVLIYDFNGNLIHSLDSLDSYVTCLLDLFNNVLIVTQDKNFELKMFVFSIGRIFTLIYESMVSCDSPVLCHTWYIHSQSFSFDLCSYSLFLGFSNYIVNILIQKTLIVCCKQSVTVPLIMHAFFPFLVVAFLENVCFFDFGLTELNTTKIQHPSPCFLNWKQPNLYVGYQDELIIAKLEFNFNVDSYVNLIYNHNEVERMYSLCSSSPKNTQTLEIALRLFEMHLKSKAIFKRHIQCKMIFLFSKFMFDDRAKKSLEQIGYVQINQKQFDYAIKLGVEYQLSNVLNSVCKNAVKNVRAVAYEFVKELIN